jgi:hypothetical protein
MYKSKKHFDVGCMKDLTPLGTINKFLKEDLSREFVVRHHVSGYRVTLKDSDYGEITFATAYHNVPMASVMVDCIERYNDGVSRKEKEKIESLARRKKQIQKELEEVSRELTAITLNKFENV